MCGVIGERWEKLELDWTSSEWRVSSLARRQRILSLPATSTQGFLSLGTHSLLTIPHYHHAFSYSQATFGVVVLFFVSPLFLYLTFRGTRRLRNKLLEEIKIKNTTSFIIWLIFWGHHARLSHSFLLHTIVKWARRSSNEINILVERAHLRLRSNGLIL